MKQKTFTQQPIVPKGYTGRHFNDWHRYIQQQLDRIKRTNVAQRYAS